MGASVITSAQASEYFADKSQQIGGVDPDNLPDAPFEYWADGPLLGIFYPGPLAGVWMVHLAAKPSGYGKLVTHAHNILRDFGAEKGYPSIMGWTPKRLRAAVAFAKRVGFEMIGEFTANGEPFVITVWSGKCP